MHFNFLTVNLYAFIIIFLYYVISRVTMIRLQMKRCDAHFQTLTDLKPNNVYFYNIINSKKRPVVIIFRNQQVYKLQSKELLSIPMVLGDCYTSEKDISVNFKVEEEHLDNYCVIYIIKVFRKYYSVNRKKQV